MMPAPTLPTPFAGPPSTNKSRRPRTTRFCLNRSSANPHTLSGARWPCRQHRGNSSFASILPHLLVTDLCFGCPGTAHHGLPSLDNELSIAESSHLKNWLSIIDFLLLTHPDVCTQKDRQQAHLPLLDEGTDLVGGHAHAVEVAQAALARDILPTTHPGQRFEAPPCRAVQQHTIRSGASAAAARPIEERASHRKESRWRGVRGTGQGQQRKGEQTKI